MKKTSTRLFLLASALLALASCAPQAFVIRPEMRGASKSGLNLNGKSMAVVYLTSGDTSRDSFNASAAGGFASRLEEDYFGGNEEIELFKMPYAKGAEYSSKDTLVHLVIESGKDVVFLFDLPEVGTPTLGEPAKVTRKRMAPDSSYVSTASVPFTAKIYVYDSMNKEDKVFAFSGSKTLTTEVYGDGKTPREKLMAAVRGNMPEIATRGGELAANTFLSTWTEEYFFVIYYEASESAWNEAANYAYNFKWDKAIEEWMTLLDCRSAEKRACAAYNIGLACFLSGQPELAKEWLDRSDKDMPVSLSKDLRNKIKQYSGR